MYYQDSVEEQKVSHGIEFCSENKFILSNFFFSSLANISTTNAQFAFVHLCQVILYSPHLADNYR